MAIKLINAATTTVTGAGYNIQTLRTPTTVRTFQAVGTVSASTGAATVAIEVSLNNSDWIQIGLISLTLGTVSTSDGFTSNASWDYVRARVATISGTTATVTVYMGI